MSGCNWHGTLQGLPGLQGATGAPGLSGRIGSKGQKGATGVSITGPRGLTGNPGSPGFQGPEGQKGERGIPGQRLPIRKDFSTIKISERFESLQEFLGYLEIKRQHVDPPEFPDTLDHREVPGCQEFKGLAATPA